MELQGRVTDLEAKGLGLAAISYDAPAILAEFSARRGITFPLLSDAGSATIKKFGLLNPLPAESLDAKGEDLTLTAQVKTYVSGAGRASPMMVGMAFPGTLMLDRHGRVTARFFEDYYVERNTVSSVMMRLGAGLAPVRAAKVSTPYLEISSYASDASVAPGNRFSIAVAVTPHPHVHVYAPGASGYRAVALTIAPQPIVRTLPVQYPKSETYFFKPLDERVAVYQKPFTLTEDVVLEGTPQAQAARRGHDAVTLNGTLEYQACDDKVCFNPASIPLTWTIALRQLVTERPSRPQ